MRNATHYSIQGALSLAVLSSFVALWGVSKAEGGQPRYLNTQEKTVEFIRDRMQKGGIADLKENSTNENDRRVDAKLIEDLLTSPAMNVHPTGVCITDAIVTGPLNLKRREIPREMWLDDCRFERDVDLEGCRFLKSVSFEGSTFTKKPVFLGMRVSEAAMFTSATFQNGADFRFVGVGVEFHLEGAKFTSTTAEADFRGMKAGDSLWLERTVFSGPVIFDDAHIARSLNAFKVVFATNGTAGTTASFRRIEVGQTALFKDIKSSSTLDFTAARISDVRIESAGSEANRCRLPGIDLTEALIIGHLRLNNISTKKLIWRSLRVEGPALLHSVEVQDRWDLSFSRLNTVLLEDVMWSSTTTKILTKRATFKDVTCSPAAWPRVPRKGLCGLCDLCLQVYYDRISPASDPYDKLLNLLKSNGYDRDVYAQMESSFMRRGDRKLGNRVFLAGRERERQDEDFGWGHRVISCFGHYVLGYGRRASFPTFWSAVSFFFGLALFWRRDGMEPHVIEKPLRKYHPFWYTLDVFVPFVNLHIADLFMPREDRWFARRYRLALHIMGLVLISSIVAAWAEIIK